MNESRSRQVMLSGMEQRQSEVREHKLLELVSISDRVSRVEQSLRQRHVTWL